MLIDQNPTCKLQPKHADPTLQAIDVINCDFERGLCNWQHEMKNTSFLWLFRSIFPHIYKSIPLFGADNSNNFIVSRGDTNENGERARILSPVIVRPPSLSYCLSFYYHMTGKKHKCIVSN